MNFLFNHVSRIQFAFVLIVGVLSILGSTFSGELIPTNDGLGFDGKHYAALAQNYPDSVVKASDTKYLQRSLPSLLVYSVSELTHLSPSNKHVIFLFSCYNLCLLLLSVYFWNKISKIYSLSNTANWIGFLALFVSFASLKFPFFYPTLTDVTGFTLSVILIYYYKTNNKMMILLIMLLSAVSWPAIEYICLALLVFQKTEIIPEERYNKINQWIAFLFAFGFVSLAGYLIYRHPNMRGGWQEHTYIVKHGIVISLLATFSVIFFSVKHLIKGVNFYPKSLLKVIDIKYGVLGIVLFIGLEMIFKLLAKHYHIQAGYSIRMYINDILIIGSRQPYCFILGHLVYFGPLFAICIFRWKQICAAIYKEGWSMFFVIVQFLFFMLDSESRHVLHYIPFIAILLVQILKDNQDRTFLVLALVLSILFSKVWISMMQFPFSEWSENYNLNFGCYFTDQVYISQLLIFVLISAVLYFVLKKGKTNLLTH